eukprot:32562-Eustigmatos_ZCMA.PRE.1
MAFTRPSGCSREMTIGRRGMLSWQANRRRTIGAKCKCIRDRIICGSHTCACASTACVLSGCNARQ